MRLPLSIALPAGRSYWAELKDGILAGRLCPFCDLPWISVAGIAYLAKSCLFHRYRAPQGSFLDGGPVEVCGCPHCVHSRNHRLAA